ncbi:MAG: PGPGW domain-containing protein [Actinomycetota bacterium]|nr:PGPGW domain-containing protein [Actinomycetota bacterium]
MTRTKRGAAWARRFAFETLGWALIVLGFAALVLPGPGLLALVAGLVILSQQYEWAERRLEPVKEKAFQVAEDGVRTWPRIIMSCAGALTLVAVGVIWGLQPPAPSWWPLDDSWWLPGGWGTGSSLIVSAVAAFAMIAYSFRRFRRPRA